MSPSNQSYDATTLRKRKANDVNSSIASSFNAAAQNIYKGMHEVLSAVACSLNSLIKNGESGSLYELENFKKRRTLKDD